MRISRWIAAGMAAVMLCCVPSAAAGEADMAAMASAKSAAESYEASGQYAFAYDEAEKYAALAAELAKSGAVSRAEAEIAAGWRDQLEFAPALYVTQPGDGVFTGSDGVFVPGSSGVRLNVAFGDTEVADHLWMIPATNKELCVLVELQVSGEKMLRDIAFGKRDGELIRNLRQMSLIEGRIYLAFCPCVNTMRNTRTVDQSFINAFRYVAKLAERYAPNVQTVYALADVRTPGGDTAERFYPGREYVDVFGVELVNTYNRSYMPSPEAAYDNRGEYYDPVLSVMQMRSDFTALGGDLPLMITGCSFPWEGKAAVSDWAYEMERFYRLIPALCPETAAVFYTNASTSAGVVNLRHNAEAMAVYELCLGLPWYSAASAVPLTEDAAVDTAEPVGLELYLGGKFNGAAWEAHLDGAVLDPSSAVFPEGEHLLEVYVTEARCLAKLAWTVRVRSGVMTAEPVQPDYDFNGNGYLDFGDTELLTARVAKWEVDLNGCDPDVNGDLRVNIIDVSALRVMMKVGQPRQANIGVSLVGG